MVDNGEISYCLGLTIKRDRANKIVTISQANYIENILTRFGMERCKAVSTPLEPGVYIYNFPLMIKITLSCTLIRGQRFD